MLKKISNHFYSLILFFIGFCVGIYLQHEWFLAHCKYKNGGIKTSGSCYLYQLRFLVSGLIFSGLLFLFWRILNKTINKFTTKKDIYKKTFYLLSLFGLNLIGLFINKSYHNYLFIIIILTILFSICAFFFIELKIFFKNLLTKRSWGFLLLTSVATVLFCDIINSYFTTKGLMGANYILRGFFLYNILIIFSLSLIFFLFLNRILLASFLTFLFCLVITITNIIKTHFLDYPLYLWDYQLIIEAIEVIPLIYGFYTSIITFILLIIAFFYLNFFLFNVDKIRKSFRFRFLFSTSIIFCLFGWFLITPDVSHARNDMFPDSDERKIVVSTKGLFYYLFLNGRFLNHTYSPENYHLGLLETIYSKYLAHNKNNIDKKNPQVNVIFHMMESFFDPADFGVKYKKDPIPFFNQMSGKFPSGKILTSIYGGMTANTEYEVMTGFSSAENLTIFFPGSTVYNQGFTKKITALPEIFNNWNYYTLGINGLRKSFMNRDKIYPLLGFKEFLAFEDDFSNMKTDYQLCSDENLVDIIIEKSKVNFPFFSFVVTMGTHGSYSSRITLNPDFKVMNEYLKEDTKIILQRYAEVLNLADKALIKMINHFKSFDKKTIIVIFGDHLPGLKDVFEDLKVFNTIWPQKTLNMYSTPLLIWANFDLPNDKIYTSANYLSLYLFNYLGIKDLPFQFKFIKELKNKLPLASKVIMDSEKNYYKSEIVPEQFRDLLESYKTIQYDIIKGNKYFLKVLKNKHPSSLHLSETSIY